MLDFQIIPSGVDQFYFLFLLFGFYYIRIY